MSTRAVILIIVLCFLQISTSKRVTKKPSDVTLKSAANDLFLIAENCSPPDHVCPVACSAVEEVDIVCVTNGQIMMKIQNRCEYERIRSCCPIYKNGWKVINCDLVKQPAPYPVESFCQSTCQKGHPVCTTDGTSFITFASECELQKAKQCGSRYNGFQIFGQFDCKWITGNPQVCSESCEDVSNAPMCASNGYAIAKFQNQCELLKAIKCCPNYGEYIATDPVRCTKSEILAMKAAECIRGRDLRIDYDNY